MSKKPRIFINGQELDPNQYQQDQQYQVHIQQRRKRGVIPCLLILITASAAIGMVLFMIFNENEFLDLIENALNIDLGRPDTQAISGDPSNFDPIASYDEVLAFAGIGSQLTEMQATFVRADGTMDLNATYSPAPSVRYTFIQEAARPDDAPPVGVGGATGNDAWYTIITIRVYEPGQRRRVTSYSSNGSSTYTYTNEGMERSESDPTTNVDEFLPTPTCAFTDLWEKAIEQGAPPDAVAVITFDADGYTFSINRVIRLEFDFECALMD